MKQIAIAITSGTLAILLTVGFACKKKNNGSNSTPDFDRKALLTNLGNNIIIPGYQALQSRDNQLDSMIAAFNAAPDADKLTALQTVFKDVYKAWQTCSPFELGKADEINLNLNGNTFPTDTTKINTNISTNIYDLNAAASVSVKGLPGIEYLLFGSDNVSLVSLFTTDSKAANRKQYLSAIAADLKTNIDAAANPWLNGGYINTFVSAAGTDVGSSVGELVNKLDYDYDVMKNDKLGVPLGKQSMGALYPYKVEAVYSGISAQLVLLQLQSMQNIYLGKGTQGDGIGFDDYLTGIKATYNGGMLNDTIKQQFTVAITKLQAVADPMSATIQNNQTQVDAAYLEVQKLLVLLKTDMPSALGVLITYADNDGD